MFFVFIYFLKLQFRNLVNLIYGLNGGIAIQKELNIAVLSYSDHASLLNLENNK